MSSQRLDQGIKVPPTKDPQTAVEEANQAPVYLNPAALAMSEQEFQEWRHNPTTRAVFLFLAHRSDALTRDAMEIWKATGAFEARQEHVVRALRGRILELEELCSMKVGAIQQFYQG